ncbi:ATP:cob(I)alamin adenosyltransferase [Nanoarchaeota archaeon]
MAPALYTKIGDAGTTRTYSNDIVEKDSLVISTNGDIDFVLASLDMAKLHIKNKEYIAILDYVDRKLWQLGGEVSLGGTGRNINDEITEEDIAMIERKIQDLGGYPKQFLRFRDVEAVHLNECRVRLRMLERNMVPMLRDGKIRPVCFKYINRVSDLLFMLAYSIEKQKQESETKLGRFV